MSSNLKFRIFRLAALCCLIIAGPSLLAQSDIPQDNIFKTKKFHTGIFRTWEDFRLNRPSITEGFTTEPVSKFDAFVTAADMMRDDAVPNQLTPNAVIHMGVILKDSK